LRLIRFRGDNGNTIEARTERPRQRSRIGREPRYKPLVRSHHPHSLPLIGGFRLLSSQVFRKDVPFWVVPMVFVVKCGVPSEF